MYTFIVLILIFTVVILVFDRLILKTRIAFERKTRKIALILLIMTAVFDNILTALPAYNFNRDKTLGIYLFKAPLEDFFYILMVVLLVGMLNRYVKNKSQIT